MTDQNAPFVAPQPADPGATLKSKAGETGWLHKANVQGSAEWHQYQDLLAAKSGMSRADYDRVRDRGATPKVAAAVPQPAAASPPLREQVLPGAPIPPEQIAVDEAALADFLSQQVPTHAAAYPDVVLAGKLLPPAAQAELKTIALQEKLAPTELTEFMAALENGSAGKVNAAAMGRLAAMTDAQFQRYEAAVRAGMVAINRYPALRDQVARIPEASRDEFFEVVARIGARLSRG